MGSHELCLKYSQLHVGLQDVNIILTLRGMFDPFDFSGG